jgi:hypothetical protein
MVAKMFGQNNISNNHVLSTNSNKFRHLNDINLSSKLYIGLLRTQV